MKIAVGFACLVTVAVLEGVIGAPGSPTEVTADDPDVVADTAGVKNDLSQCEVARGVCQSKETTCVGGELLEDVFYCESKDKPYCCIPLGCVYGSIQLRNGAFIIRGCTKLICDKGTMKKDDSECKNEKEFKALCGTAGGLLLSERCFFSNLENNANSAQASWNVARDSCVQFITKSSKPHLPLQLASFADINIVDIPTDLRGRHYWTGGSDTAGKDSWKWLDGKIVSAASIPDGCLSVEYDGNTILYTDEPCTMKNDYICELPKDPIPCICIKKENGCTLGETNMPKHACQCKLSGDTCEGIVVKCKDEGSLDCIHPGIDFEHCRQGVIRGQGNCCGYDAATC